MRYLKHSLGFIDSIVIVGLLIIGASFIHSQLPNIPKKTLSARILKQSPTMSPEVLSQAIKAYEDTKSSSLNVTDTITIVDYSKPSDHKRLWVIDMLSGKIIFHTYVAHGKNSGYVKATRFSNKPSSYKSCLGVLITGKPYYGQHGLSLRLHGLEPGTNDNAFNRTIVIHSASYVSEQYAQRHGRLGRSHGCLALSQDLNQAIINEIKDGSLLFIHGSTYKYSSPKQLNLT